MVQHRYSFLITSFILAVLTFFILTPLSALASARFTPARTQTVAAGSYIVDVKLEVDPIVVDQPFEVQITPHDSQLQLNGTVVAQPGSGTDATDLPYKLTPLNDGKGTIHTTAHIPVRGAWDLAVQLDGSQGSGEAKVSVVVGAPGAMPSWLAWAIGSFPLWFIAIWILYQHRYRNKLAAQSENLKEVQPKEQLG